jgi:hypothetical protein
MSYACDFALSYMLCTLQSTDPILNEATSSVGSETEELIQQAIYKIMRGRTSVVIAHKLNITLINFFFRAGWLAHFHPRLFMLNPFRV